MADTFERFESANATLTNKSGSVTSRWITRGPVTEDEAIYELRNTTPVAYVLGFERLVRTSIAVSKLAPTIWQAEVTYEADDSPNAKESNDFDFRFSTTGATAKKTLSETTVSRHWLWSMSNMPPDLGKLIGAQNGKVEGVDAVIPKLEFSVTAYYPPARVTMDWVKNLARATGRTNNVSWLSYEPGELLFLGADGSGPVDTLAGPQQKPVQITLNFAASENRDDLVIGTGNPEKISKKGWEYLWVRYERVRESGLEYPIPVHAYVERIYPELDFTSFFGFGGSDGKKQPE